MLENRLLILTIAYLLCAWSLVASERLVSKRSSQTQSQSSASTNNQDPNDEGIKKSINDDSHLRLYYKVNSPGRSVSQELEHRIVKNPNYQQYNHHRYIQETNNNNNLNGFNYYQPDQQFQQQSPRYNPYTYDPRTSYLIQQLRQQQQQQQPVITHNINSNPNLLNELERNRLLNLNYRLDNLGGDANHLLSRPIYQQVQQMQQVQQQNLARNNLLKQLLLLNNDHQQHLNPINNGFRQQLSPLANFNQQPPSPAAYEQSKSENGLQYKIVHLKFKIEPQQGRLTGHGLVESDTGSGPVVNSRRFSLMPGELPELMKRLMSSAGDVSQSSGQFPPSQSPPYLQHPLSQFYLNRDPTTTHLFSPTHTSLIKKRQDEYYNNPQSNDNENSDVEKRSMSPSDDDSSLMSYESSGEDDSETSQKRSDETEVDDDKMSDAELNESLKSLQKRTVDEDVDEDSQQKEISTRSDDSNDESDNNETSQ